MTDYPRGQAYQRLDRAEVVRAIMSWPGLYETPDGRQFYGSPVSEVPARLRDNHWRNVSHLRSDSDYTRLGLEVVEARYIGGVRPKRFCQVVVAKDDLEQAPYPAADYFQHMADAAWVEDEIEQPVADAWFERRRKVMRWSAK